MTIATTLDVLVKITQLIGIPVGIIVYARNKRKERIDREYGTYDALDQKYIDYLKLCLANSDLDVADMPKTNVIALTAEQSHRQTIMFLILLSIMERAYIMYKDKSDAIRQSQWSGWNAYIQDWLKRGNFAAALPMLSTEFDVGFCAYLKQMVTAPAATSP
jgi:hypothetical protein